MMRIGTDISIAECRCSGYMVMDYKKRNLFKNGVLNKDCAVLLSVSNPSAWNDCGKPMIFWDNHKGTEIVNKPSLWNLSPSFYSWNDLMELISEKENRDSVASYADWEHCSPNFDSPNEYDLLNLASDIHSYFGLN